MKFPHRLIGVGAPAAVFVVAMLPAIARAQHATPAPGEYQVDGGWGKLVVKREADHTTFKINALGANAHSCEIDGAIRDGIASVDTAEKGQPCRVEFNVTTQGIDVKPLTEEQCRVFCGARASFDGLYAKAVPGCEEATRMQMRTRFKKLYDAKQFQEAHDTLQPLLTRCEKSLHWIENGAIRNDFAITQYHLNDYNGCLETLREFDGEAADTQLENLKATEPSSAEAYAAILTPARHNIALCAKAARQKQ